MGTSAMVVGTRNVVLSWKLWVASPICLRLLAHCTRAEASRTFCTAGKSKPIRMAMMAITTSSSINVKPRRWDFHFMVKLLIRARENSGEIDPAGAQSARASRAGALRLRSGQKGEREPVEAPGSGENLRDHIAGHVGQP